MSSPTKLAHIVLKSARYDEMISWWSRALGADVRFGDGLMTFLSYDEEHHRIAIMNDPNAADAEIGKNGLEHFAFTFSDATTLVEHYDNLKAVDVDPYWTINHGMTLSAYYRDPDGNQVEFQIDLVDAAGADQVMASPGFAANPIGIPADFDELSRRLRANESLADLLVPHTQQTEAQEQTETPA